MYSLIIDWENQLVSFAVNILSGILVSLFFLFLLLKFYRPKIIISNLICSTPEAFVKEDGQSGIRKKYSFKILNTSIYNAFDATFELFSMESITHTSGKNNLRIKRLSLRTSNMTNIKRYRKNYLEKDPHALFAILLHTNEPLETYLSKEYNYLELRVTLRHGLTGLAETFTQHFPDTSVINNECKFEFGKKIGVIPIIKSI